MSGESSETRPLFIVSAGIPPAVHLPANRFGYQQYNSQRQNKAGQTDYEKGELPTEKIPQNGQLKGRDLL